MTGPPVVTIAATPREWASRLHAHAADHGGVVVRATVLTAADAREESAHVLLVDDITSFLTAHLVTQVRQRGRAVLGMYDPDDPQGKSELVDVGVDALLPADAEVVELVRAIHQLAARRPADRLPSPQRPRRPRPVAATRGTGRLTGVLGCSGGVGATEVALALAAASAATGEEALLLDLDELGPALAQRLRLRLHPNLRTAVEALLRDADVAGHVQQVASAHRLEVLVGLAIGADHALLPHGAVAELVRAVAVGRDRVVLDLGRVPVPADGEGGRRFGHAHDVVAACHDVVLVAAPTPASVTGAVGRYAQLYETGPQLSIVLNRVGANRFVRDEAIAVLRRSTGLPAIRVVPEDPRVGAAAWEGIVVGRGRFARAVAGVAHELATGGRR